MDKLEKPLEEWREALSAEQFEICRLGGTERAFTGEYYATKPPGVYLCACCATPSFDSEAKYDSGCGCPCYFPPVDGPVFGEEEDFSRGMQRTEVRCAGGDAHGGHGFPAGPRPTGLRYCITSASLK